VVRVRVGRFNLRAAGLQSRTLGPGSVITATFAANLPRAGGKTVVMTPTEGPEGRTAHGVRATYKRMWL